MVHAEECGMMKFNAILFGSLFFATLPVFAAYEYGLGFEERTCDRTYYRILSEDQKIIGARESEIRHLTDELSSLEVRISDCWMHFHSIPEIPENASAREAVSDQCHELENLRTFNPMRIEECHREIGAARERTREARRDHCISSER
jgi:hypothetical protein